MIPQVSQKVNEKIGRKKTGEPRFFDRVFWGAATRNGDGYRILTEHPESGRAKGFDRPYKIGIMGITEDIRTDPLRRSRAEEKKKGMTNMKLGRNKATYVIVAAILLAVMCVGLVIATVANRADKDLPVMAEVEDTEPMTETEAETEEETVPETEEETEAETEPEPVDISSKGLEFTSNGNGTCYVSGMGSCRDSVVILPLMRPEGDRVEGIGDYAFRNCTYLRAVDIHEGIRSIGAYAFYGSGLVGVNIPAEVVSIGDYAFTNCDALERITVDEGNAVYSDGDGVLYNKNKNVIITFPMGKRVSSFSISSQVYEIKTMAFYNCNSIKLVNYEGGAAAFRRIQVGAGNEPIESAVVTFTGAIFSVPVAEK